MTVSMTGFAARKGQGLGYSWTWDLRSVNGKGLDLRLRVPDWIDGLELMLRGELQKALGRGNVSLSLKVGRDEGAEAALRVNPAALSAVLSALHEVETAAMATGVTLAQPTSADVLALRGVLEAGNAADDTTPLRMALIEDFALLLADFAAMRASEGTALQGVIAAQLDRIAELTRDARAEAATRNDATRKNLAEALARVMEAADAVDEGRIAQELALIAVKNDITEELDRLGAHVDAARLLIGESGPVGRKFDFLMQEFMREANTLCSKAQSLALTRIGLDLKTVIDQLREQVQNVE